MNNPASVSINDVYRMLLPLSNSSKIWLGKKLIADANRNRKQTNGKRDLVFPHISKDKRVSSKAMSLVIGEMPKGFDYDKATNEMWEEFAK